MWAAMGRWLVLASCVLAAVSAAQDNALRFLNHKEMVRMAQQKHSDEVKVFASGFKDDLPMEKFRAQSTVCPNGITECPDSSTCCPLQDGQYGCCQGVNAVCCKDGVHCCPEGYKCDEQHGRCASSVKGISFQWVDKKVLRAQPVAQDVAYLAPNRTCPGNKTHCIANDTCCPAVKGYGCCPLPNAACCSDRVHCCPMGTKCDMVKRRCYRQDGDQRFPWVERRPEKESHSQDFSEVPSQTLGKKRAVICKDGLMCPDGNTCCLLQNGSYGCCPYSDAVCCSDHVHCCPQGCECDYVRHGCVGRGHVHNWSRIVHPRDMAIKKKQSPAALSAVVVCPGGQYECQSGQTCCQLASGEWGCCSHPNAVCCPDGIHCCPHGYTCRSRQCQKPDGQDSLPWSVRTPAVPREEEVMVVKCPDGSVCDNGSTCCLLLDGKYGCCPYSEGVCCKDKKHCCPNGYTCDVMAQTCNKSATAVPFLVQKAAVSNVQSVICPDGSSECPDGSTCCKMSSGQYGCCPQPNAVCCSDDIHCCPEGSTCDLAHQTCKKGQEFIPWVEKVPSPKRVQSAICPGGHWQCPDGSTCCKLTSGRYGCCPVPNAVCCSDGIHCCPQATTCNGERCQRSDGQDSLPWSVKTPAVPREEEVMVVKCPDGSVCDNGSTCCLLLDGKYGCCPYSEGVCCKDKKHCCPNGYTCDVMAQTCNKSATAVPFLVQKAAVSNVQSVICPDGSSECPDGSTCCKMSSGQYGCCPQPNAVCCSDGIHCCPEGSTCDLAHQTCKKGQEFIPWVEKVPSPKRVQIVICPDGQSECPDGNTCCKLTSGQYGCCPLPDAVCCSDGIHCCPQNTTCDLAKQTCDSGHYSIPWEKKLPARHSLP